MFSESLGNLLKIIKSEERFKIQIITREDIKVFIEFLDYHNVPYYFNCWNSFDDELKDIQIYTSKKYLTFDAAKIILYSPERDLNFIQFVFVPSFEEKQEYLKSYWEIKDITKTLNAYKSLPIHELISKIDNRKNVIDKYISEYFDYHEILLIYAISKCTNLIDIITHVQSTDEKVKNGFIIRMKLNDLVSRGIVLFKNNNYKLNISIHMLTEICKKSEINVNA